MGGVGSSDDLGLDSLSRLPGSLSKWEVVAGIPAANCAIVSFSNHAAHRPASINEAFNVVAAGKSNLFNHDRRLSEVVQGGTGWRG